MSAATLDDRGVLVACSSCGTKNRMNYRTLDRPVRCGKCKMLLPPPAAPIEVPSVAAFDALGRDSVLPIVVDFWAPWCGPCRMVAPELEKVARTGAGEFLVVKVNTEALPELAGRYRIASIPTMAVLHGDRELKRTSGARPAPDILAFVRGALPATAS